MMARKAGSDVKLLFLPSGKNGYEFQSFRYPGLKVPEVLHRLRRVPDRHHVALTSANHVNHAVTPKILGGRVRYLSCPVLRTR